MSLASQPVEDRGGILVILVRQKELLFSLLLSSLILSFCGCRSSEYQQSVEKLLFEPGRKFRDKKGKNRSREAAELVDDMLASEAFKPLWLVGWDRGISVQRYSPTFEPNGILSAKTLIECLGEPDVTKDTEGLRIWVYYCEPESLGHEGSIFYFIGNRHDQVTMVGSFIRKVVKKDGLVLWESD